MGEGAVVKSTAWHPGFSCHDGNGLKSVCPAQVCAARANGTAVGLESSCVGQCIAACARRRRASRLVQSMGTTLRSALFVPG